MLRKAARHAPTNSALAGGRQPVSGPSDSLYASAAAAVAAAESTGDRAASPDPLPGVSASLWRDTRKS